ncbi:MAG: DUF4440 domain-containing protein [Gemmatimonadota bacterium]
MSAIAAIRARRAASNMAITARDLDGVAGCMLPDVRVSVAGGPVLIGRDASRRAFAEQFAEAAFRGYVRETADVQLQDPPVTATETGRWTGRWRRGIRDEVMRGRYVAEWRFTELGWFIASESFISEA